MIKEKRREGQNLLPYYVLPITVISRRPSRTCP